MEVPEKMVADVKLNNKANTKPVEIKKAESELFKEIKEELERVLRLKFMWTKWKNTAI